MSGITDLDKLLRLMRPELSGTEFVFCTATGPLNAYVELNPVATFNEAEGLSANMIAAYYYDHVFVQASKASAAFSALNEFSVMCLK